MDTGAVDAFGVPGWVKADKLVQTLLDLLTPSGLSIKARQASNIVSFQALDEFNKNPLYQVACQQEAASGGSGYIW